MIKSILPWLLWFIGIIAVFDAFGLFSNTFRKQSDFPPIIHPESHPQISEIPELQPVLELMDKWGVNQAVDSILPDNWDNPLQYWMESSRAMRQLLNNSGIQLLGCRWFGWEKVLLYHPGESRFTEDERHFILAQLKTLQSIIGSLSQISAIHSMELVWASQWPAPDNRQENHKLVVAFTPCAFWEIWEKLILSVPHLKIIHFSILNLSPLKDGDNHYLQLEIHLKPKLNESTIQEAKFPIGYYSKTPVWLFPNKGNQLTETEPKAHHEFIPPRWDVLYYSENESFYRWRGLARFEDEHTIVLEEIPHGTSHSLHKSKNNILNGAKFDWEIKHIDNDIFLNWVWGCCRQQGYIRSDDIIVLPMMLCVANKDKNGDHKHWIPFHPMPWDNGQLELIAIDTNHHVAAFQFTDKTGKSILWQLDLN